MTRRALTPDEEERRVNALAFAVAVVGVVALLLAVMALTIETAAPVLAVIARWVVLIGLPIVIAVGLMVRTDR